MHYVHACSIEQFLTVVCLHFKWYVAIAAMTVHLVATGAGCLVILFVYKRSLVHSIKE